MKTCQYAHEREEIVAVAMQKVATELRLIDAGDLISMIRYECHSELADLVSSAAELYFMPGTVTLGAGGEYFLDWNTCPKIKLDIVLKPAGVTIYCRVTLQENSGAVEIDHINFEKADSDPATNTAFLKTSLLDASFLKVDIPMLAGVQQLCNDAQPYGFSNRLNSID